MLFILRNRAYSIAVVNWAHRPITGHTIEASIFVITRGKRHWAISFTCVNWMLNLVACEILSPYGYCKVRNTSRRFLWPRTGPHTLCGTDVMGVNLARERIVDCTCLYIAEYGVAPLAEEWQQEIHEWITWFNETPVLSPALTAFASMAGCIVGFRGGIHCY